MHMNTMYACKNAGRAGSTPVVGTTFSVENRNSPSTESKLNQFHPDGDLNRPFKGLPKKRHRLASSGMELPETVSYRNLTARITHSAKDGLYHAYWNCGGHRGKAASKKFERAKGKALAALKLIQKGHAGIASLNNRELRRLMAARDLLRDAGIDLQSERRQRRNRKRIGSRPAVDFGLSLGRLFL